MSQMEPRLGWINYWKPKDDWYYLPRARREQLLRTWTEIRATAVSQGARCFGTYECRANTPWARVALWEFPGLGVMIDLVEALASADYYQYFAEENAFGRQTDDPYHNFMVAADATGLEGA